MIEATGLNRFFGPTHAVKDLSFTVERGEIVGFLGPNGAGKTTTMRMLTGTLRPSAGKVTICGFDMAERPLQAKRSIGYLPEVPPIDPAMVVEDYLSFAAALHGMPAAERPQAVDRAVAKTSLGPVRHRLVGALSKGYRQRVGIAQALVHDPPVIILDEPAGGLDPEQIQELRRVIRDLRGEHTVLLSTHIMQEVAAVCDRAMIIDGGRLLASDSLESLAKSMRARRQILARVETIPATLPAALLDVPGVTGVRQADDDLLAIDGELDTEPRPQVAAAIVAAGAGLLELREETLDIEEVFLQLIERARAGDAA